MILSEVSPDFEALLEYLKRTRGFDFTGYKRSSLMRRVHKRMQEIDLEDFNAYQDYLEVHPEEFARLFNTLLINVTCFFRERSFWDYIAEEIIPRIIAQKLGQAIRVWSAGCASGEEAYTLAILLAEALGVEQFRDRVKIYATDVDEEALSQARFASYDTRQVSGIPDELLLKYFESAEDRYVFRKDLRRSVIFGRHDLVQDAPISRVDLLTCRNTLMYFNAETQAKILARFHFALVEQGFLFLGKAETMLAQNISFAPIDLKRRIFAKTERSRLRSSVTPSIEAAETAEEETGSSRIWEAALDVMPVAQIIVNANGLLIQANEQARRMFGLNYSNFSRPLQDLELSYRPVELRSAIERVYADRRTIVLKDIEWLSLGSASRYLDVQFALLSDAAGEPLGVSVTFEDVTDYHQLQQELEQASQELEMAYEELQSTNEELETTNEELQSMNEELETTNEELQSTNEELETMNEELQATNEELQTINTELHSQSEEVDRLNVFLESILASLQNGVAVLNRNLHVLLWNREAEELWGVRSDEVKGQHFLNLDIGLPVEHLRQPIRGCLLKEPLSQEITLDSTNRRGKVFQCKVTCSTLSSAKGNVEGVILIMEPAA